MERSPPWVCQWALYDPSLDNDSMSPGTARRAGLVQLPQGVDLAVLGVGVDVDDLLPGGGQAGQEGGGQVQAVHRAGGASCQGDQGGVDVLVKDVCRWEDEK